MWTVLGLVLGTEYLACHIPPPPPPQQSIIQGESVTVFSKVCGNWDGGTYTKGTCNYSMW
jgi:hypothetical protein